MTRWEVWSKKEVVREKRNRPFSYDQLTITFIVDTNYVQVIGFMFLYLHFLLFKIQVQNGV